MRICVWAGASLSGSDLVIASINLPLESPGGSVRLSRSSHHAPKASSVFEPSTTFVIESGTQVSPACHGCSQIPTSCSDAAMQEDAVLSREATATEAAQQILFHFVFPTA